MTVNSDLRVKLDHFYTGWKGLDCEDNSAALDEQEIFLQFLLLTVSNIVFIPVLILALYRQLFTEAFLYLIASIFSVVSISIPLHLVQTECQFLMTINQIDRFLSPSRFYSFDTLVILTQSIHSASLMAIF